MAIMGINLIAVLGVAVLSMVLGALWYSPVVFGTLWMRLSGMGKKGLEKAKQRGMAKLYLVNFITTLVMSFVLAQFIVYTDAETALQGAVTGFWLWLGFIATTALGGVLWEGKSVKLYLLNIAYYLVALLVMGGILAVWL